jgi:hypothetical protein
MPDLEANTYNFPSRELPHESAKVKCVYTSAIVAILDKQKGISPGLVTASLKTSRSVKAANSSGKCS